ncbi:MAG TPA: hypothetical protein VNY77_09330 [Candidatus Angelobacter sp.]|jgi:hypothetical protein|nr:hypothetical protein [Candidatus Angelobacter sp.]
MVKRLLRPLRRWAAVEGVLARIAGQVKTWPADDFGKFVSASIGTGMAGAVAALPPPTEPLLPDPLTSIAPATFEMRFMKLHAEGRFDEMWEMLAEDAQRAWGGRETFMRDMPRLEDDVELLDMQVVSVKVVEEWIDQAHQRAYVNVARMVMRYRVRQQWREWTFDRQVHLVPAAGGWRTLCYPTRVRTAVGR